jgi:lipid A 3-O-deacylase
MKFIFAAAALAAGALLATAAHAQGTGLQLPSNTRIFFQPGLSSDARYLTVGATWDWAAPNAWGMPGLTGYWEAAIGRWEPKSSAPTALGQSRRGSTQIGFTPVFRFYPAAQNQFFVEGGIGINVITPLYRNGARQFSTVLNFGDLTGAGLVFGPQAEHELAVRYQHFSNASIKRPNPGANVIQLRYAYKY